MALVVISLLGMTLTAKILKIYRKGGILLGSKYLVSIDIVLFLLLHLYYGTTIKVYYNLLKSFPHSRIIVVSLYLSPPLYQKKNLTVFNQSYNLL